ncbi:FtsB family cell division protein [Kutzneria sp. CA-103260]|uniref:FtsB family cell division protein n=1 Tax=Kutzneria sp. CA-103260 TaxID=2802641 RepID=UPI001BAD4BE2|nr:septum formation initiator family protein [Kutzneria sp. CA-103260]QUQ69205.1 Cell division protein FtsL [Kutzneria sp. CA-103260]
MPERGRQPRRRQDTTSGQRRGSDRARRTARPAGSEQESPPRPARTRRTADRARTGGAFGLSATRQAAVLAMVVCALALSIAVPLRTYLTQHAQVEQELAQQAQLQAQAEQLEQRKQQLSDPAQIQAEARSRLGMVMPGETPYTVQLPGDGQLADQHGSPQQQAANQPWFGQLWNSITGSGS